MCCDLSFEMFKDNFLCIRIICLFIFYTNTYYYIEILNLNNYMWVILNAVIFKHVKVIQLLKSRFTIA